MPVSLYLASQSPRRSQLLAQIGVAHTLLLPDPADPHPDDTPEALEALEAVRPGEAADVYVQRVTLRKLQAAQARARRRSLAKDAAILCADTTVALDGVILGKPADAQEAAAVLRSLAGRRHAVLTAVAFADGAAIRQALSVSQVDFAPLDQAWLAAYLASGQWRGKAGSYGIQGLAGAMVARIEGSYSGIMGLPLHETYQLLRPWLADNAACQPAHSEHFS
ncbi:hypothetical protein AAV94_01450 [Lampropedia cohaerens]|uniref:dTTP/UTP pyrophosphatase n=1 Tax=Lampropedia cohaerens TaxID=1610491 RepID=A0A0U1Q2W7_9BURK|nr:Maf family protein [Lampropedia cohaerens]KKW69091.1 hypothetical protein AAV94_01450 [Lampropedia cohaerens]